MTRELISERLGITGDETVGADDEARLPHIGHLVRLRAQMLLRGAEERTEECYVVHAVVHLCAVGTYE